MLNGKFVQAKNVFPGGGVADGVESLSWMAPDSYYAIYWDGRSCSVLILNANCPPSPLARVGRLDTYLFSCPFTHYPSASLIATGKPQYHTFRPCWRRCCEYTPSSAFALERCARTFPPPRLVAKALAARGWCWWSVPRPSGRITLPGVAVCPPGRQGRHADPAAGGLPPRPDELFMEASSVWLL